MHQLKQMTLSALSLAVALPILVVAPVLAEHGSGSGGSDDSSQTTTTSTTTTEDNHMMESGTTSTSDSQTSGKHTSGRATRVKSSEVKTEAEAESETAETESPTELHQRGKSMMAQIAKEQHEQHSDAQRKQACSVHKDQLEKHVTKASSQISFLQTRIDGIYAKALAYKSSQGITNTNIVDMVAKADAAKSLSQTAISNLAAVTPTLDCTRTDNAENVATYRVAAASARDALKSYRTSVRTLLLALRDAKASTNDATEGAQ